MQLRLRNETDPLQALIVGIAQDRPANPHGNNPKILENMQKGNLPTEAELVAEVNGLAQLLADEGVQVLRPDNIPNQDQIFARDIGFVIDDTFVRAGMRKPNRRIEVSGIQHHIEQMERVLTPPEGVFVEGGDVILHNDYVFVGLGERTNAAGVQFLKDHFPQKEIIGLPLVVSEDPYQNVLHLDCAFQPVGAGQAILYEAGFVEKPQAILDIFGEKSLIRVGQPEMYAMYPNVFSVRPDLVLIEEQFTWLADQLHAHGIRTRSLPYEKVSRFGGLLRCSTLPLFRQ
ncbi:MAG: dimethylarginine dimethylaminohydrolase family protein [Bernardetiaceae bacterium]